jgi:hypothetical protein
MLNVDLLLLELHATDLFNGLKKSLFQTMDLHQHLFQFLLQWQMLCVVVQLDTANLNTVIVETQLLIVVLDANVVLVMILLLSQPLLLNQLLNQLPNLSLFQRHPLLFQELLLNQSLFLDQSLFLWLLSFNLFLLTWPVLVLLAHVNLNMVIVEPPLPIVVLDVNVVLVILLVLMHESLLLNQLLLLNLLPNQLLNQLLNQSPNL